jgi:hypothetical protein
MPLARGIAEVLEAIPERIEVSGTGPTWRVTGGSFESVVSWANDAFDEPVVIAREDRSRWWTRVTLTVTNDPDLIAEAPPLECFIAPEPAAEEDPVEAAPVADPEPPAEDSGFSALEDMFARQEEARVARLPEQRGPDSRTR